MREKAENVLTLLKDKTEKKETEINPMVHYLLNSIIINILLITVCSTTSTCVAEFLISIAAWLLVTI